LISLSLEQKTAFLMSRISLPLLSDPLIYLNKCSQNNFFTFFILVVIEIKYKSH